MGTEYVTRVHCLKGFPMRAQARHRRRWPDAGPPRFRRVPFVRDVAFDPGRATAPRISVPHILPSTSTTASAPALLSLSWLSPTSHTIAVYASWPSLPAAHATLATERPATALPGPVFHRLDRASLAWRTVELIHKTASLPGSQRSHSCNRYSRAYPPVNILMISVPVPVPDIWPACRRGTRLSPQPPVATSGAGRRICNARAPTAPLPPVQFTTRSSSPGPLQLLRAMINHYIKNIILRKLNVFA